MAGDNSDEQVLGEVSASAIKSPKPRRLILPVLLTVLGAVLLIHVVSILFKPHASEIFRLHVLDPIPTSVTNIKTDQPKTIGGYGYVLRFEINREDLNRIIKSRSLNEAQITGFLGGGSLFFKWKGSPDPIGRGFSMYGSRKPSWYTLESWDNPETYALVQKEKSENTSDIQVLIYNASLGQAFFIVFDYGGDAIWG